MRSTRAFLLLLSVLAGCGGVKVILHSPVESRCQAAGLQGCPEMTDGVILFVEGKEEEGKVMLERGAAANAPAKVKKFAKAIRELKQIPGAASYAGPLFKVADILAAAKGGKAAPGAPGEPDEPGPGGPPVDGPPGDRGVVNPATARDRIPCGALGAMGYCIRVVPGPLALTELTVGAGCPGEVAVGAARTGDVIEVPRWVARNPRGPTDARAVVRRGETLYVGVQANVVNDPRCTVTWAGTRTANVNDMR